MAARCSFNYWCDCKFHKRNRAALAEAVVAGAIAVAGAAAVPQSGFAPLQDEAKSSVENERSSRARTQRGATRDQGGRNRGSSGKS